MWLYFVKSAHNWKNHKSHHKFDENRSIHSMFEIKMNINDDFCPFLFSSISLWYAGINEFFLFIAFIWITLPLSLSVSFSLFIWSQLIYANPLDFFVQIFLDKVLFSCVVFNFPRIDYKLICCEQLWIYEFEIDWISTKFRTAGDFK